MAEDLYVGFKFFQLERGGPYIANEAAVNATVDRVINEKAYHARLDHMEQAVESVGDAAARKAGREDPPQWDDNLPPDLSDDFWFVLG